jgi:hypothetical protein
MCIHICQHIRAFVYLYMCVCVCVCVCVLLSFIPSVHGISWRRIACPCEITNKRKVYSKIPPFTTVILAHRNDFSIVKICLNSSPLQSHASYPIPWKSVPTPEWKTHIMQSRTAFPFLFLITWH